ncbi:MAG: hypothetical protein ACTSRR_11795 [Candidatus Heimdallarchaeaceae archaeon]
MVVSNINPIGGGNMEKRMRTLKIPDDIYQKLAFHAKRKNVRLEDLILEILDHELL